MASLHFFIAAVVFLASATVLPSVHALDVSYPFEEDDFKAPSGTKVGFTFQLPEGSLQIDYLMGSNQQWWGFENEQQCKDQCKLYVEDRNVAVTKWDEKCGCGNTVKNCKSSAYENTQNFNTTNDCTENMPSFTTYYSTESTVTNKLELQIKPLTETYSVYAYHGHIQPKCACLKSLTALESGDPNSTDIWNHNTYACSLGYMWNAEPLTFGDLKISVNTENQNKWGKQCTKCPPGTYNDIKEGPDNKPGCKLCPLGKYQDEKGQIICKTCPEGGAFLDLKASTENRTGCATCDTGGEFHEKYFHNKQCVDLKCLRGEQWKSKTTIASEFESFSVVVESKQDLCESCPAGFYHSSGQSASNASCTACELGKYQNDIGKSFCKACGTGKYHTDGKSCGTCPAGSLVYDNNESATLSERLSDLNNNRRVGNSSSECKQARAPFYASHEEKVSILKRCPGRGTMTLENGMSEEDCQKCPLGQRPESIYGAYVCKDCPEGRYGAYTIDGATCLECPKNTYQNQTGQYSCNKCNFGYTDRVGTVQESLCQNCADLSGGYYCTLENNKESCPQGYSCVNGRKARCQTGKYKDNTGASECKNCPSGFATAERGAFSCPTCAQGKYQPNEGEAACIWCLSGKYADYNADRTSDAGCKSCETGNANYNRTACVPCATGFFKMGDHCKTCNPGSIATEDNRVCTRPTHAAHEEGNTYVYTCDGKCRNDDDGDRVCNEFEVTPKLGCTNPRSCNFDRLATNNFGCAEINNAETCLSRCATGNLTEEQCKNQAQYEYTPTNEKTCVLVAKDRECILKVPGFVRDEGLNRKTSCNDLNNATKAAKHTYEPKSQVCLCTAGTNNGTCKSQPELYSEPVTESSLCKGLASSRPICSHFDNNIGDYVDAIAYPCDDSSDSSYACVLGDGSVVTEGPRTMGKFECEQIGTWDFKRMNPGTNKYHEVIEVFDDFRCMWLNWDEITFQFVKERRVFTHMLPNHNRQECASAGTWKKVRSFCKNNPSVATEERCFDGANRAHKYSCRSVENIKLEGGRHLSQAHCEKDALEWQAGMCYDGGDFTDYWTQTACETKGVWTVDTSCFDETYVKKSQCELSGCGEDSLDKNVVVDVCGDFSENFCKSSDLPQCYYKNGTCTRVVGNHLQAVFIAASSALEDARGALTRKEFEYEATESKYTHALEMYQEYTLDRLSIAKEFEEDGYSLSAASAVNAARATRGDYLHVEVLNAVILSGLIGSADDIVYESNFQYGWQADNHYERSIGVQNYNDMAIDLQFNDTTPGYYRTAFILEQFAQSQYDRLPGINATIESLRADRNSKQEAYNLARDRLVNSNDTDILGRTCSDPTACNFCVNTDSSNFCPFAFCRYAKKGRVCAGECRDPTLCDLEGECIRDQINPRDNKCDEEEVMGCTDRRACNYNPRATFIGYKKCQYPPPFRECKKPYLTENEIRDTQAYIDEIRGRVSASRGIWSQALSNMSSTLALPDLQYVENSGCGSELIAQCNADGRLPTSSFCSNYVEDLEPYPDAATADKIMQDIAFDEYLDLYDDGEVRQWFLQRQENIAPAIKETWNLFLDILDRRDQTLRLASCAAMYAHHQKTFEMAQTLNVTYLHEKSVHDTLQEDLEIAQTDLASFLWFANKRTNLTVKVNKTHELALRAKANAETWKNKSSTAENEYEAARSAYDAASDLLEEAEEDLADAESAAETQQFLLDNLPVDWTDQTAWAAWLDGIPDAQKNEAESILQTYRGLESQRNTSLNIYNTRREDALSNKTEFDNRQRLYTEASDESDKAMDSNDTYWGQYDEAVLELEREDDKHDLSTANTCIHDRDGDGTCDEEDAHAACSLPPFVSDKFIGVCNQRPGTGAEPKIECGHCETGKYTESVCTNAHDQTVVDTHTYADGTTTVDGDCTNPLVDTEWLNQYYCLDCPAGWFGKADSLSCAKCEVGSYQDETGKPGCKLCKFGVKVQQYEASTSCNDCDGDADPPYGNDAFGNCEVCDPAAGRVLDRVTGTCGFKICPRGQGVGEDGECEPCVFGETYSATASNLPCLPVLPCGGENGTTPSVISLTKAPVCVNRNITLMDSNPTLKARINLCVYESNCDTVLPALDTRTLKNFDGAFKDYKYFNVDIGGWHTSSATSMASMFEGAGEFDQDVGGWDTSKVRSMRNMFKKAVKFNHNIEDWNTRSVTDMQGMFHGATHFNQDLNEWNLNSLENAADMFYGATLFDGLLPVKMPKLSTVTGMFRETSYSRHLDIFPAIVRTWAYTYELQYPYAEVTSLNAGTEDDYRHMWRYNTDEPHVCLYYKLSGSTVTWYCGYTWKNSYELSNVLPDSYQKQIQVGITFKDGQDGGDLGPSGGDIFDWFVGGVGGGTIHPRATTRYDWRHEMKSSSFGGESFSGTVGNFSNPVETLIDYRVSNAEQADFTCAHETGTHAVYEGDANSSKFNPEEWSCVEHTICDYAKEWESFSGSAVEDRKCTPLTDCAGGKFVILKKTDTSDRVCVEPEMYLKAVYNKTQLRAMFVSALDKNLVRTFYEDKLVEMPCKHKMGLAPTFAKCTCGKIVCNPGEHCDASKNVCSATAKQMEQRQKCGYGSLMCSPGEYCHTSGYDTSVCLTYLPTNVPEVNGTTLECRVDNLLNEAKCVCGSQVCQPTRQEFFCKAGECSVAPFCPENEEQYDGTDPSSRLRSKNVCRCKDTFCDEGEACSLTFGTCTNEEQGFCPQMNPGREMTLEELDHNTERPEHAKCQGPCTDDEDCQGDLKCYAQAGGLVPGCKGEDLAHLSARFCYDASLEGTTPLKMEMTRMKFGSLGTQNLNVCQGHCRHDDDCKGGLKCSKRERGDSSFIPGCNGVVDSWDDFYRYEAPYGNLLTAQYFTINFCYNPDFEGASNLYTATETEIVIARKRCACGNRFATTAQWCDHHTDHASDNLFEVNHTVIMNGETYDVCPFNGKAIDRTGTTSRMSTSYSDGTSHDHNGPGGEQTIYEDHYFAVTSGDGCPEIDGVDTTITDYFDCQSLGSGGRYYPGSHWDGAQELKLRIANRVVPGGHLRNVPMNYNESDVGVRSCFLSIGGLEHMTFSESTRKGCIRQGYNSARCPEELHFESGTTCTDDKQCMCKWREPKTVQIARYDSFNLPVTDKKCLCAMRDAFRYDDCVEEGDCIELDATDGTTRQCQSVYGKAVDVACGHEDCEAARGIAVGLRNEFIEAQKNRASAFNPHAEFGFCYETYRDYFDESKLDAMKTGGRLSDLSYYRLNTFEQHIANYRAETDALNFSSFMLEKTSVGHRFKESPAAVQMQDPHSTLQPLSNATLLALTAEQGTELIYQTLQADPDLPGLRLDYFEELSSNWTVKDSLDFWAAYTSASKAADTAEAETERHDFYFNGDCATSYKHPEDTTDHLAVDKLNELYDHLLNSNPDKIRYQKKYEQRSCAFKGCLTETFTRPRRLAGRLAREKHRRRLATVQLFREKAKEVLSNYSLNTSSTRKAKIEKLKAYRNKERQDARRHNPYSGWCAPPTHDFTPEFRSGGNVNKDWATSGGTRYDSYAGSNCETGEYDYESQCINHLVHYGTRAEFAQINTETVNNANLPRCYFTTLGNSFDGYYNLHASAPRCNSVLPGDITRQGISCLCKGDKQADQAPSSYTLKDYYEPYGKKIGTYHENECGREEFKGVWLASSNRYDYHNGISTKWVAGYCGCREPRYSENQQDYDVTCRRKCNKILDHYTCEGKVFGNITAEYGYEQANLDECRWVPEYSWCDRHPADETFVTAGNTYVDKGGFREASHDKWNLVPDLDSAKTSTNMHVVPDQDRGSLYFRGPKGAVHYDESHLDLTWRFYEGLNSYTKNAELRYNFKEESWVYAHEKWPKTLAFRTNEHFDNWHGTQITGYDKQYAWNEAGMTVCQLRESGLPADAEDRLSLCQNRVSSDTEYFQKCAGDITEKYTLTNKPQRRTKKGDCWCQHEFVVGNVTHRYPNNCIDVDETTGEGRCRVRTQYDLQEVSGFGSNPDVRDENYLHFAISQTFEKTYTGEKFEFLSEFCPYSPLAESTDAGKDFEYRDNTVNWDATWFGAGIDAEPAAKCCKYGSTVTDGVTQCLTSSQAAGMDVVKHFEVGGGGEGDEGDEGDVLSVGGCMNSNAVNFNAQAEYDPRDQTWCIYKNDANTHVEDFTGLMGDADYNINLGNLESQYLIGKAPTLTGGARCLFGNTPDGECVQRCNNDGVTLSAQDCYCVPDWYTIDLNFVSACSANTYCLVQDDESICSKHPLPIDGLGKITCPDNSVSSIDLGAGRSCQCGGTSCVDTGGNTTLTYCHAEFNYCSSQSALNSVCPASSDVLTADCYCGTGIDVTCNTGQYCFLGFCTDIPLCVSGDGFTASASDCQCGNAGTALAGQYCKFNPNLPNEAVISDSPIVTACSPTTAWDGVCECGTAMCDSTFQKCRSDASQCSKPDVEIPWEKGAYNSDDDFVGMASVCDQDSCRCGGDACPDDANYCTADGCHFVCGKTFCGADKFCIHGVCQDYGHCANQDGTVSGGDSYCSCGTSTCGPHQYCFGPDNLCMDSHVSNLGECANTDATSANQNTCRCGPSLVCTVGQYCNEDNANGCEDVQGESTQCPNAHGISPNVEYCVCGTNMCSPGQYCSVGQCTNHPNLATCAATDGQTANALVATLTDQLLTSGTCASLPTAQECFDAHVWLPDHPQAGTSQMSDRYMARGCSFPNSGGYYYYNTNTNPYVYCSSSMPCLCAYTPPAGGTVPDCQCGTSVCEDGEYCTQEHSVCTKDPVPAGGFYASGNCGAGNCPSFVACPESDRITELDQCNAAMTAAQNGDFMTGWDPWSWMDQSNSYPPRCTFSGGNFAFTSSGTSSWPARFEICYNSGSGGVVCDQDCTCGGSTCSAGETCSNGVCSGGAAGPVGPPECADTNTATDVECVCGTATCAVGERCDAGESTCFLDSTSSHRADPFWKTSGTCEEAFEDSQACKAGVQQVTGATVRMPGGWEYAPKSYSPNGCVSYYESYWEARGWHTILNTEGSSSASCDATNKCLCLGNKYLDCSVGGCRCGANSNNCRELCDGGVCTCRDPSNADIQGDSCSCGSTVCQAGERCEGGVCTKLHTCENQLGEIPSERKCGCGSAECSSGEYCDSGVCSSSPSTCQNVEGTAANVQDNKVCTCNSAGGTVCDSSSPYCDGSVCRSAPNACTFQDGAQPSSWNECSCGDNVCSSGEYCRDGECQQTSTCDQSGAVVAPDACDCVDTECSAGQYCRSVQQGFARVVDANAPVRVCRDFDLSVVTDPSSGDYYRKSAATIEECAAHCSGGKDVHGRDYTGFRHERGRTPALNVRGMCYCTTVKWGDPGCGDGPGEKILMGTYYQFDFLASHSERGECLSTPLCPDFYGFEKIQQECACDTTTCSADQYCNVNVDLAVVGTVCSLSLADCPHAFGLTRNSASCECNTVTCDANQYCHRDDGGGVCNDEASTNYMAIDPNNNCDGAYEIESLDACAAFCRDNGNPVDPGNCQVRDLVGQDGDDVAEKYPPGCSLHKQTGAFSWNSKKTTTGVCAPDTQYGCVCYSADQDPTVCADQTGLVPLPNGCLCDTTRCATGQYCFDGRCYDKPTYASSLQEENCEVLIPTEEECEAQCKSGHNIIDQVYPLLVRAGHFCAGPKQAILDNSVESPWSSQPHTGETCKDTCLSRLAQGDLGDFEQGNIPGNMYFSLQHSSRRSQWRCVCHKFEDTQERQCSDQANLAPNLNYDVYEIKKGRARTNASSWSDKISTIKDGYSCAFSEFVASPSTGLTKNTEAGCRDACQTLLETGALNSDKFQYTIDTPTIVYINNKVLGVNRQCLCMKPGTLSEGACELESLQQQDTSFDLLKYERGNCVVQEVNNDDTPPGCSLNRYEQTYYFNSKNTSSTTCEASDAHMCSCGPGNKVCASTDGTLPHDEIPECKCGTETCGFGKFCDAENNRCMLHPFCSSGSGQTCTCGTNVCGADEYCDAANSACMKELYCANVDGETVNENECRCEEGGEKCDAGEYCLEKSCTAHPVCENAHDYKLCRAHPSSGVTLDCNQCTQRIASEEICFALTTIDSTTVFGNPASEQNTQYWSNPWPYGNADKLNNNPALYASKNVFGWATETWDDPTWPRGCFLHDGGNYGVDKVIWNKQGVDDCSVRISSSDYSFGCVCDDAITATYYTPRDVQEGTCSCGEAACRPDQSYCKDDFGSCSDEPISLETTVNSRQYIDCSSLSCICKGEWCNGQCFRDTGCSFSTTHPIGNNEPACEDGQNQQECVCGEGPLCGAGEYCDSSARACTAHPECGNTDGTDPNDACWCESKSRYCGDSQYCFASLQECYSYKKCSDTSRTQRIRSECMCGRDKCHFDEYCHGDRCSRHETCAHDDGNTVFDAVAPTARCECGSDTCRGGQYCHKDHNTCYNMPPCAITNGQTKNDGHCRCGTGESPDFCSSAFGLHCYAENAKNTRCSKYPPCLGFDDANLEKCRCGSGTLVCHAGEQCNAAGASCQVFHQPLCANTDHSSANADACRCGTVLCGANQYCNRPTSQCFNEPLCANTDDSANADACQCGEAVCGANQYCNGPTSQCFDSQHLCANTDHSLANADACRCGATECGANQYCNGPTSQCFDKPLCANTDDSENADACRCGTAVCGANQYCHASADTCFDKPLCANTDDSLNADACRCGTAVCGANQYCHASADTCFDEPLCANTDHSANADACRCGTAVCGANQYCTAESSTCSETAPAAPAPAPAPDSAPDSSPDCGLGAGERVCPQQLNEAFFTDGSIHTKLSGFPQVKKWYRATHAQNTIDPSGMSAAEKPGKDHWGVKLQYCESQSGEPGTGGPYDTTTCNTDGVHFYEGGCATQLNGEPQIVDGECPMIYSLDTAQQKETEANNFVGSGGGGGNCNEYNNAIVESPSDAENKKQQCENDASCTWIGSGGGPYSEKGVYGACEDDNNGPSGGDCSGVDPSQCCSTSGCALDESECYATSDYPGRVNDCDGGGGESCNEATCSDHSRTAESPCASVSCGYDSSSGQCSCDGTDPEPIIGAPDDDPSQDSCIHYAHMGQSACDGQPECRWDGTNCIVDTGDGTNYDHDDTPSDPVQAIQITSGTCNTHLTEQQCMDLATQRGENFVLTGTGGSSYYSPPGCSLEGVPPKENGQYFVNWKVRYNANMASTNPCKDIYGVDGCMCAS